MRLIDADALKADIKEKLDYLDTSSVIGRVEYIALNKALTMLDEQPIVDAVEVVRCKDCKHFNNPDKCFIEYLCRLKNEDRSIMNGFMISNWYCPIGERKNDGKN